MLKSVFVVSLAVAIGIGSARGRMVLGQGLTSCDGWTRAQGPERSTLETWIAGYCLPSIVSPMMQMLPTS